jgi:hypothetical protein
MFLRFLTGALIIALSRDQVIRSFYGAISISALTEKAKKESNILASSESSNEKAFPITFQDALELINKSCPDEYLNAVKNSGNFLYRGERIPYITSTPSCYVLELLPDLLSPTTYGCSQAVEYFQAFEGCCTHLVRPSTSHIATTSLQGAALWGRPVSVWPLGKSFAYAFPKQTFNFFDCNNTRTSFESSPPCKGITWNTDLKEALDTEGEVMFTTMNTLDVANKTVIVACPAPYYNLQLMRALSIKTP